MIRELLNLMVDKFWHQCLPYSQPTILSTGLPQCCSTYARCHYITWFCSCFIPHLFIVYGTVLTLLLVYLQCKISWSFVPTIPLSSVNAQRCCHTHILHCHWSNGTTPHLHSSLLFYCCWLSLVLFIAKNRASSKVILSKLLSLMCFNCSL